MQCNLNISSSLIFRSLLSAILFLPLYIEEMTWKTLIYRNFKECFHDLCTSICRSFGCRVRNLYVSKFSCKPPYRSYFDKNKRIKLTKTTTTIHLATCHGGTELLKAEVLFVFVVKYIYLYLYRPTFCE